MSNCCNFGNGPLIFDILLGRVGNYIPTLSLKLIMYELCHIFNSAGLCLGVGSNLPLFFRLYLLNFL